MIRKILFILMLAFHAHLHAQTEDAQLWENIYFETNISRNWYAHINHEGRITDNMSAFNYAYLDGGFTRKFGKHYRFSLDYVYVDKAVKEGYWSKRHQVYVSLTGKKKYGNFVFYDRQMFQLQVKDIYSSDFGRIPEYYLRNKLTIRYKTKSRYTPYVAEEIYLHLNTFDPNKTLTDRGRYSAGCFYAFDPINEFELYYLYEHNYNSNKAPQNYVVGVGFSHTFY